MWKTGTGEFSFCGKPESENSRFVENQNRRILVLWETRLREFSFCGKRDFRNFWKARILVLWKTRIREFWFCEKRELEWRTENWKTGTREFAFFGKPESENSRFGKPELEIFFFSPGEFLSENSRLENSRGKRELENSRFLENQNWRFFFFLSENSCFVENGNWRILVLWKTRVGEFFFYPRILVLWKTGTGEFQKRFLENQNRRIGEISFCRKRESDIFRFLPRIRNLSENSRFVENGKRELDKFENPNFRFVEKNPRILVLWEIYFFFFYPRILVFGKRELESRFVENENPHFFLSENSRFVENGNWISFCGKPESEIFLFFLSENSRFVENQNRRIFFFIREFLVLWKTRIGEFLFFLFFFIREFSFCGKRELENSRFVKNQNWRIFFFIREFSFCGNGAFSFCGKRELENSRFVENRNRRFFFFLSDNSGIVENQNRRIFFFFYPRILVLWKTGTREFSYCGKPESENFFFFLSENSHFVENGNWRILVL